ncbi:MAG: hypothetical protein A2600_03380 [Candidatus Lambdaproteobacteria bacterium RIFOXYD1_FULL_56_27]|uniref:Cytochrome c-552/4 domain-containing protein n=1 Tax=Candidatus Lambdaproteobacteria bacterium RIFOXYD2_FULL_56_26 TaxID=1817773 RepID=A0A1F6H385_9PROT|nr:MAG: hypothetical protein A2426_11440 [Candidatus Lambdaproteobacteria bacterium RIFOXYC1_FULL_56_13]OGH04812.1 MAG: hypothetical protein A2557_07445 [Candidatus Lambdaproteobacteria bacterium RIFOXYD2_FULL_56_26]OGH09277.1 MAG: hypothetical protein A2600_03380 [Candidatus Lambdaproteobacteria bacterium RIFOXYD1_FULL_56_27]
MRFKAIKAFLVMVVTLNLGGCFLHLDVVESPPNTASAELCGECHKLEYAEWKESGHARAWVSENFKKETDDYQVEKCLACHRANPIYGAEKLTVRANHPKEGVTCVTCHLTPDNEMGGPHFVLPAHFVKMSDPYYLDPKLCGSCHESHYEQWKASKARLGSEKLSTCQDCHMPAVHRKLITSGPMQYFHWAMDGKKHSFTALPQVPEEGKPWFESVTTLMPRQGETIPVKLTLRHRLPHGVPSGIFGFKAVDLTVSFKSANGLVIEEMHRVFHAEKKEFLKPGEDYQENFLFSRKSLAQAEFVEIRLVRRDSRISLGQVIFLTSSRI